MANDYFKFRQFTIQQGRCAMKVGTDGTLLGAWAHGGKRILDIGTGTGLIALMMAQRFPESQVTAFDIDEQAVMQARENVVLSPFASRISILCEDARCYEPDAAYDAIVSNPPFYDRSLVCPDNRRSLARHTSSLDYRSLFSLVQRCLDDEGEFSVVIPSECQSKLESEASLAGFFKVRECAVRTIPRKAPRRYLLAFAKHPSASFAPEEGVIEEKPGSRSSWYTELTKDFYL
ncbi:MAG: methyltransferase [Prevotella sp.]|nr:methyltransferase [Prevotella sp.]